MGTLSMAIPENVTLLPPWEEFLQDAESQRRAEIFAAELRIEVSSRHPLFGFSVRALAWRCDQDDVLFEVVGRAEKLAVVHLTWSQRREADPRYPSTRLFSSWQSWLEQVMRPDHDDYTCGDTPWW
jgi:hypothetical protein